MTSRFESLRRTGLLLMAMVIVAGLGFSLLFGDGCGPVERGMRAVLGTWDMWDTPMVSPYQQPLTHIPEGSLSIDGAGEYGRAHAQWSGLSPDEKGRHSANAYRRFCHHCHGPNGDGRIIVGESFGFRLPDLRSDEIQRLNDAELFFRLTRGTRKMIPLAATLSALDRLAAISHLRTLKNRPSEPFFPPQWVEPAEKPGGPGGS